MIGLADIPMLAVLPILPAVPSLLVVLTLGGSALIAGLWSLRHPWAWKWLIQLIWSQRLSLLTLGLVGALAMGTARYIRRELTRPVDPIPSLTGEWPARGGLSRQASVDDTAPPTAGGIQWVGGVGYSFYASPAVADGRVYCVGSTGDRGRLFCWEIGTGRLLWTAAPPGMRATFSSPIVHGSTLIVGEGLHHTTDASVYCIDLRSGREGVILWQFATRSHIECTPVVDDGNVFVTAGDDGVYCLRLVSDASNSDRLVWHVPGERLPDVETTLAVDDGRVYVGTGIGGQSLVVLDAGTGNEVSRLDMPLPVYGLPAFHDDHLYIGMGDGDLVNHQDTQGQVVCFDRMTLEQLWAYRTPGTTLGAVACDDAGLVLGCADGHVYALSHDGDVLNSWNSRSPIVTSQAVQRGMAYVVNGSGLLYGLRRNDLSVLWETRLGSPDNYVSSPVVANGHILIGTPNDGFLCVGEPSSAMAELPTHGHLLWSHETGGRIVGSPGVIPTTIVVPVANQNATQLVIFNNNGDQAPAVVSHFEVGDSPWIPVATFGEIAVACSRDELFAIDAPTSSLLWRTTVDGASIDDRTRLIIDGTDIWLKHPPDNHDGTSPVRFDLQDGSRLADSRHSLSSQPPEQLIVEGALILSTAGESVDRHVWADCSKYGDIITNPVIHHGRVYVCTRERLLCLGTAENE